MKIAAIAIVLTAGLFVGDSTLAQDDDAWNALNRCVPAHVYPMRGRIQRAAPPNHEVLLKSLDETLTHVKGTSAEPMTLYYRANTLFFLDRFADALAAFEDIAKRFPAHGLVKSAGKDLGSLVSEGIEDCKSEMEVRKRYEVTKLPHAVASADTKAVIHTAMGDITLELYDNVAPATVANFVKLAKSGFYNDTYFHRIVNFHRVEGGCPNTKKGNTDRQDDGLGSPGHNLPLEWSDALQTMGAVSMRSLEDGKNAHGSQFTICVNEQPQLNNSQAVFGRAISGIDVLRRISQQRADETDNPYESIWIRSVEIVK